MLCCIVEFNKVYRGIKMTLNEICVRLCTPIIFNENDVHVIRSIALSIIQYIGCIIVAAIYFPVLAIKYLYNIIRNDLTSANTTIKSDLKIEKKLLLFPRAFYSSLKENLQKKQINPQQINPQIHVNNDMTLDELEILFETRGIKNNFLIMKILSAEIDTTLKDYDPQFGVILFLKIFNYFKTNGNAFHLTKKIYDEINNETNLGRPLKLEQIGKGLFENNYYNDYNEILNNFHDELKEKICEYNKFDEKYNEVATNYAREVKRHFTTIQDEFIFEKTEFDKRCERCKN